MSILGGQILVALGRRAYERPAETEFAPILPSAWAARAEAAGGELAATASESTGVDPTWSDAAGRPPTGPHWRPMPCRADHRG